MLVFVADADGSLRFADQPFERYTGLSSRELAGQGWLAAIHPDEAGAVAAAWREAVAGSTTFTAEFRLRAADGRRRWFLARGSRSPSGSDEGTWVTTLAETDDRRVRETALARLVADAERKVTARSTELRRTEARLADEIHRREAIQSALIQSQKLEALGQLASGVAHDFNNVLAGVLGAFHLIGRRSTEEAVRGLAGEGATAARKGAELVRQLLAFMRREGPASGRCDLALFLADLEPQLRLLLGPAVRLSLAAPADLPDLAVDSTRLYSALVNLAVNARDAMPDGGVLEIRVETLLAEAEDYPTRMAGADAVVIHLRDTGEGMAPAVLQKALEPFFTTKPPGRGTGLGLAMVNGLMLQIGGVLRVQSRLGAGATVSLYVPIAEADAVDEAARGAAAPVRHRGGLVLLVEDDPVLRPAAAEQLADLGYGVIAAPGVRAALSLADGGRPPDLVLCDLAFAAAGDDRGAALAARLRAGRPNLPIVFMSDDEGPPARSEPSLRKPVTPEALSAAILEALAAADRRAAADDAVDRLKGRLRSSAMVEILALWAAARGAAPTPSLSALTLDQHLERRVARVGVDQTRAPMTFTVLSAGDALTAHLGADLSGVTLDVAGDQDQDVWEGLYRRCVASGRPTYDFARYGLGEVHPLIFERLLLPCSSDGKTVDGLMAVVEFSGGGPPQET